MGKKFRLFVFFALGDGPIGRAAHRDVVCSVLNLSVSLLLIQTALLK
jgi:hypothetical protein